MAIIKSSSVRSVETAPRSHGGSFLYGNLNYENIPDLDKITEKSDSDRAFVDSVKWIGIRFELVYG